MTYEMWREREVISFEILEQCSKNKQSTKNHEFNHESNQSIQTKKKLEFQPNLNAKKIYK